MRLTRPRPARVAWWVVALCLLALLVLGVLGAGVMPSWGSSCPDGGDCDPVALRSVVLTAWGAHGLALAGLVGGMFAVGRTRPESPHGDGVTDEHASSPWRHALLAAGFVAVTNAITAGALGLAMIFGGFMVGAVVAAWWVGLTVFLDALDRLSRPDTERRGSWWRALAVSTVTVAMLWVVPVIVVGIERRGWSEAFLVADVLVAGVTGLATLWSRLARGGGEQQTPDRTRVVAAAAVGSLVLPVALVAYTDLGSGTRVRAGELLGDLLNPYPAQVAAPPPADPPSPEEPAPPPVAAPCTVDHLRVSVVPGDPSLSATTATLVLRNAGGQACTVTGYPDLRLRADDEPVDLFTIQSAHLYTGDPATAEPVTLEPDATAHSLVWWRERRAPEDEDAAERELRVLLGPEAARGGVRTLPVDLTHDVTGGLADGSRVRLEPWQAGDPTEQRDPAEVTEQPQPTTQGAGTPAELPDEPAGLVQGSPSGPGDGLQRLRGVSRAGDLGIRWPRPTTPPEEPA